MYQVYMHIAHKRTKSTFINVFYYYFPQKSLYRNVITSYRMRLCCYKEQRFVISEVRNEIHSLQIFHMARKRLHLYKYHLSQSRLRRDHCSSRSFCQCHAIHDKHISCGCDVTVLLSQEKRAHRVRLRHVHVNKHGPLYKITFQCLSYWGLGNTRFSKSTKEL